MDTVDKHCYNCGKLFRTPAELERHKKRKTPCLIRDISEDERKNPNRCIYCNKILSKKEHLTRHLTKCKVKNGGMQTLHDKVKHEERLRIKLEEGDIERQQLIAKNKDLEVMFSMMQAEIEDLKAQVKAHDQALVQVAPAGHVAVANNIGGTVNNVMGNNTTNNTTNNINLNITINNYNKPNLDYIKNDVSKFEKLLKYEMAAIPIALVEWVWYDRDHPENTSAHLVNKKTGEVLVSIEGKWVTNNVSNVIPELRRIVYELSQYMISNNRDALITFATDHVPAILARNLIDENVIKMDEEDILQKMITGREVSQEAIGRKQILA